MGKTRGSIPFLSITLNNCFLMGKNTWQRLFTTYADNIILLPVQFGSHAKE